MPPHVYEWWMGDFKSRIGSYHYFQGSRNHLFRTRSLSNAYSFLFFWKWPLICWFAEEKEIVNISRFYVFPEVPEAFRLKLDRHLRYQSMNLQFAALNLYQTTLSLIGQGMLMWNTMLNFFPIFYGHSAWFVTAETWCVFTSNDCSLILFQNSLAAKLEWILSP